MPNDQHPSLLERLRSGANDIGDDEIDDLLPESLRSLSAIHWTPVEVARRAARFLAGDRTENAHILDVGAGVGKMCVIGAATTGARFTGVERRAYLTEASEVLARRTGVSTAEFVCGAVESIDWSSFSGFYFYNPFGEQFLNAADRIDSEARDSWLGYIHLVRTSIAKLYLMREGTRVATYHGLGAPLPPGYALVDVERYPQGTLHCYVRRHPLSIRPPADFDETAGLFDEPTQELTMPDTRAEARESKPS